MKGIPISISEVGFDYADVRKFLEIDFKITLALKTLPSKKFWEKGELFQTENYRQDLTNFEFVVVTFPPSTGINFGALFSPFDSPGWSCGWDPVSMVALFHNQRQQISDYDPQLEPHTDRCLVSPSEPK